MNIYIEREWGGRGGYREGLPRLGRILVGPYLESYGGPGGGLFLMSEVPLYKRMIWVGGGRIPRSLASAWPHASRWGGFL